MRATDPRVTTTLALTAVSVWLGGMLALGAIAAPVVFTLVPRPEAADAMTVAFQRFDMVCLACVGILLFTETLRALGRAGVPPSASARRLDVVRVAAAAVGTILVLVEALWLTPGIVALHRGGAIRGLGPAGLELDRLHGLAETCGKAQVVVAMALIALYVVTLPHGADAASRASQSSPAPSRGGVPAEGQEGTP